MIKKALNGNAKWIITMIISVIAVVFAYGKQCQLIEEIAERQKQKADIVSVEKDIKYIKEIIYSMREDFVDLKLLIQNSQKDK